MQKVCILFFFSFLSVIFFSKSKYPTNRPLLDQSVRQLPFGKYKTKDTLHLFIFMLAMRVFSNGECFGDVVAEINKVVESF